MRLARTATRQNLLSITAHRRRKRELNMKHIIFAVLGVILLVLTISKVNAAEGKATAREVVEKVRQAANTLSQSGEAGPAQFYQKKSPWIWKDTYIFVFDCSKVTIAAHPIRPDLIGKDTTRLRGTKGTEFFPKLCQATKTPSGVWVEYWWPKPGEKRGSRKVSYALNAGDTPYIVGAGIYDDKTTIADLEKLTSGAK
jgi:cytochrome c